MNEKAQGEGELRFGPFRLDPAQRLLFRTETSVALRPKTLGVLLLLLRRAGEVVSKDEILASVWEGAAVSEYVLTTCISELRAALGEKPRQTRFLKTVHGVGYRMAAELRDTSDVVPNPVAIVGRAAELRQLDAALRRARKGQRQVVFVTGELGVGKTTLVDAFVETIAAAFDAGRDAPAPGIARGQCVEQFGAGEPYMPIFEAIGRLGREVDSPWVVDVLRRHAPTWLIQIPGLLPPDECLAMRREFPPETQEHMLRQIADGIEALCADRLVVILLEDLHLSDRATLELIQTLALRRGRAHLLVVGTFRSAEEHPGSVPFRSLLQPLLLRRQGVEIPLAPLTLGEVEAYLARRFAGLRVPDGFAATIHERTEGNALFLDRLVNQLLNDEVLRVDPAAAEVRLTEAELGQHVPRNLREMVEQRTDALAADELEVLETASVCGVQFRPAMLAAVSDRECEDVEQVCAQLGRRHGFIVAGASDEGTGPESGVRFRFSHAFYRQVLYERLTPSRRQRLHRAVADHLRRVWAGREAEVAAELASHFELAGDQALAIEFYDKAAVASASQGANREAVGYLDRALALLEGARDEPAGYERELDLLMTRGPSVLATAGYGSVEVLHNYERALDLARRLDNPIRQMACLLALAICEQTRAQFAAAERLALELIDVARRVGLPEPFVAQLHNPLSQVRLYQGKIEESLALADAAVAAMDVMAMPMAPLDSRPALWGEPRIMLHCQRAAASFASGRLAQAGTAVEQAMSIARELRHPFNFAYACCFAALYEDTAGRWDAAVRFARQAIETTDAYDFSFWGGVARILCGHAMACRGEADAGVALLREGIEVWLGTGGALAMSSHFNMLAEACLAADDLPAARSALDRSMLHANEAGERVFVAETLRLQAECERRSGAPAARVQALLRQALGTARTQGASLWALRAALALHLLAPSIESSGDLAEACRPFDAEPAISDVAQARALLAD